MDARVLSARIARRRKHSWRTAKACGPGPPMLGSSLEAMAFRRRRQSKPVLRGERAISRNTIAQGMPVAPAGPVVTAACVFCCRRAMGAACIRHSLRPLLSRAANDASPGHSCRGNDGTWLQTPWSFRGARLLARARNPNARRAWPLGHSCLSCFFRECGKPQARAWLWIPGLARNDDGVAL